MNPDIFPKSNDFIANTKDLNEELVGTHLRNIIQPFVLRRFEWQLRNELLPVVEFLINVPMQKDQQKLYDELVDEKNMALRKSISEKKNAPVCNVEMLLQKCTTHPWLIPGQKKQNEIEEKIVSASSKFEMIDYILANCIPRPCKVLIFASFKDEIELLESYFTLRKYTFVSMDGDSSSEERDAAVKIFKNDSEVEIFIATCKVGGLGLNLQWAEYVILLSTSWNPNVDHQAVARAHRIGQKRQVVVFHLVAKNSIDEKKVDVAQNKDKLDKILIGCNRSYKITIEINKDNVNHIRRILQMGPLKLSNNACGGNGNGDQNAPNATTKRKREDSTSSTLGSKELVIKLYIVYSTYNFR